MKFRVPPIHLSTRLEGKMATLKNRLVRAPYFRGHGVHSPYVYDIVREVFMCKELQKGDTSLYDALLQRGVDEYRAMQLQNLKTHCNYSSFAINEESEGLCLITPEETRQRVMELILWAEQNHKTVIVMQPYVNREWQALCQLIVKRHRSTTVDNRGYLIVFNNHLPKQHFRI